MSASTLATQVTMMMITRSLEAGFYRVLLSPHKLIFDAYQLIIACEQDKSEPIAPTHLNFDETYTNLPLSIFGILDRYLKQIKSEESIERYINRQKIEIWQSIIIHYSGRVLSVFEDRLPALAGIVSRLSKC